jgi:hypothetical protein
MIKKEFLKKSKEISKTKYLKCLRALHNSVDVEKLSVPRCY